MIQVPGDIIALLHEDHCQKNIRIHFPNGERTDICNDLIVKDSVSFTESLCSQNKLKFGLCESPIFECEVVGVGNIKGATIEVYCEIECDSTTEGAIFRPDLGFFVYPIPYGTFVVESSKRQADMIHRKIMAYGYNVNWKKSSGYLAYEPTANPSIYWNIGRYDNYEELKDIIPRRYGGNYDFNIIKRLCNRFPTIPIELFNDVTSISWSSQNVWIDVDIYPGIKLRAKTVEFSLGSNAMSNDNLYYFERDPLIYTKDQLYDILSEYADELYQEIVDPPFPESFLMDNLKKALNGQAFNYTYEQSTYGSNPPEFYDGVTYFTTLHPSDVYTYQYRQSLSDMPLKWYLYPQNATDDSSDNQNTSIFLHVTKEIGLVRQNEANPRFWSVRDADSIKAYQVNTYEVRGEEQRKKRTVNEATGYVISQTNDNSPYVDVLSGLFELNGVFGGVIRTNGFKYVYLREQFGLTPNYTLYPSNSLHPERVTGGKLLPMDYQSCWYDDEYTKRFGAVSCEYTNLQNEKCIFIYYLNGFDENSDTNTYQVYYIKDNPIISQGVFAESTIQAICEAIANNIEGVTYMPVDFVGRGLPYVEIGDTFEVLTRSNNSITTIVLHRTITGEMTLTDTYKSV